MLSKNKTTSMKRRRSSKIQQAKHARVVNEHAFNIPDDCLCVIFTFASSAPPTIELVTTFTLVCKQWNQVAMRQKLWKSLCCIAWPVLNKITYDREALVPDDDWKQFYRDRVEQFTLPTQLHSNLEDSDQVQSQMVLIERHTKVKEWIQRELSVPQVNAQPDIDRTLEKLFILSLAKVNCSEPMDESERYEYVTVEESMSITLVSPSGASLSFEAELELSMSQMEKLTDDIQVFIDDLPCNASYDEKSCSDEECEEIELYSSHYGDMADGDMAEFTANINRAHKALDLQHLSVSDLGECLITLIDGYSSEWFEFTVDKFHDVVKKLTEKVMS